MGLTGLFIASKSCWCWACGVASATLNFAKRFDGVVVCFPVERCSAHPLYTLWLLYLPLLPLTSDQTLLRPLEILLSLKSVPGSHWFPDEPFSIDAPIALTLVIFLFIFTLLFPSNYFFLHLSFSLLLALFFFSFFRFYLLYISFLFCLRPSFTGLGHCNG